MSYSVAGMLDQYKELVAKRDAKLAEVAPLQEALEKAKEKANEARHEATALAQKISDLKGGQEWLDLKKTIAGLTVALSAMGALKTK